MSSYLSDVILVYYNYRHYNPVDGRWITLDILQNSIYKNNYAYVNNSSLISSDRLGLLTVGIDGTDYNVKKHKHQKTNVSMFLDYVDDYTKYFGGPGSDIIKVNDDDSYSMCDATGSRFLDDGPTFNEIKYNVYKYICAYREANRNEAINIIGWSRGGHIAVQVADLLNRYGCSYAKKSCNGHRLIKNEKNIRIQFLGLFDSVDRAFFNWTTDTIPSNVEDNAALIHTDPDESILYNSQWYKRANIYPVNNLDNSYTTHGDVGGKHGKINMPLIVMIILAKKAGVKFKSVPRY